LYVVAKLAASEPAGACLVISEQHT
jgi:hypothetical protein